MSKENKSKKIRMKFYTSQIFALLIVINLSSRANRQTNNNQTANCKNFRNGTFEMYSNNMRIVLERTDSLQIEKSVLGNSKYKIRWTSECEYELELLETDVQSSKKNIGRKYIVKIIESTSSEYTYECTIPGIEFTDKNRIKKID